MRPLQRPAVEAVAAGVIVQRGPLRGWPGRECGRSREHRADQRGTLVYRQHGWNRQGMERAGREVRRGAQTDEQRSVAEARAAVLGEDGPTSASQGRQVLGSALGEREERRGAALTICARDENPQESAEERVPAEWLGLKSGPGTRWWRVRQEHGDGQSPRVIRAEDVPGAPGEGFDARCRRLGGRPAAGQARAQARWRRCSPRVVSRRRFSPASRRCSHALFFATPR